MHKREALCDQVCRMIGIRVRVSPKSTNLSRGELERLIAHLAICHTEMEAMSASLEALEVLIAQDLAAVDGKPQNV